MLHVLAAMLSLLLLAGLFGKGLDDAEEMASSPTPDHNGIPSVELL